MQKELDVRIGEKVLAPAAVWLITAIPLLLICAAVMTFTGGGERVLAYLSSAISFLTALAAALAAVRCSQNKWFISALMCSALVSLVLLSLGFVIGKQGISPDGILSVVMFTFSGGLIGGFFGAGNQKRGNKRKKYRRKKS